jgi:hypothetical protein
MSEEDIRTAAYEKWEAEGHPEGAHERHWQEAQEDLRVRQGIPSNHSGSVAPQTDPLETKTNRLVQEYLSLGGRRLSKIDDNIVNVRQWEDDPPVAETFWQTRIETLSDDDRKQIEILLPSISSR